MKMNPRQLLSQKRQVNHNRQVVLTFYAVEIMLVCFIALKPWFSTLITLCTYGVLYSMMYRVDGATGAYLVNYILLAVVCGIGMTVRYHGLLKASNATIQLRKAKDLEIKDKMNVLQAIVDIYDKVNLIDFNECTEMSVRELDQSKYYIDLEKQTHTKMTQDMRRRIMPDQLSISIGYAAYAENDNLTIHELEKRADKEMYRGYNGYCRDL